MMEETWYLLYNLYGLTMKSGTKEEMDAEAKLIKEQSKGEAGKDGRKLKFYCLVKKEEFISMLANRLP